MKYGIYTDKAPNPNGNYSQGTSAARYIFISAQLPQHADEDVLLHDNIKQQTLLCLQNIEEVLKDVSMDREDITKTTVYITDIDNLAYVDQAYNEFFFLPYPARTVIEVSALPQHSPISIDCIACR